MATHIRGRRLHRVRKLIGTVVLVLFVIVYALVAMAIGAVLVPNHSGFVALVFYVVAGLGWVLPAGLIIKWMERGRP